MLFRVLQYRSDKTAPVLNHVEQVCMEALMKDYQLTQEQAVLMIDQLCIFGFGLGYEIALGHREISDEEIDKRLGLAFLGTLMMLKKYTPMPCVAPELRKEGNERLTLNVDF